jgi:predicted histone-like DNA-binding protein
MSIFYKKVQRQNPLNRAVQKWYLVLKSLGTVKSKEVAKQMADETTMNPKEAEIAVYELVKVLKRLLVSGYTVQLDDLGTFYLTINSEGVDTEEGLTANNLTKLNIRFRASAELKAAIEKAELTALVN